MTTSSIPDPAGDGHSRDRRLKRKSDEIDGLQKIDQMDDNLEEPNIEKNCTIANKDLQSSHLESDSTANSRIEQPKMDKTSTANLAAEGTERNKKAKQSDIMSSLDISGVNHGLENDRILNKNESTAQGSDVKLTEHHSTSIPEKDHLSKDSHLCPEMAPIAHFRRKLIVLDVNGLLAHIVMPAPKDRPADVRILGRAVFKRPSCDDFLKFCLENFDVGIWSSRSKIMVENLVNYLFGDLKHKLLFCWDISHSTQTGYQTLENGHKPLVIKELKKIWEKRDPNLPWEKGYYDKSNTLLLDDSPYKALLNPRHTAIFPYSFHYNESDNSLGPGGDLRVYLEGMLMCDDVQKYVEQQPFGQRAIDEKHPFWCFYSGVRQSALSRSL